VGSILGVDNLVDNDSFGTVAHRRKSFTYMLVFRAMITNGLRRLAFKRASVVIVINALLAAAFLGRWNDRFAVLVCIAAVLTRVGTAYHQRAIYSVCAAGNAASRYWVAC
jgi:hypothetical protein